MPYRGGAQVLRAVVGAAAYLAMAPLSAQVVVPAGAQWKLGDGTLAAGGSDLRVGGQLQVQGGTLQGLRHLDIQAGGTLDNGAGHIRLAGDWRNAGNFSAASGAVEFVDGAGVTAAQLSGSSTFFDLSFVSALGKHYVFAVGTVQTVAGLLGIQGSAALPIQFQSSAAGQVAALNLLPGGTQNIAHVGVSDVHATGQPLAPLLSNEGGSGNAIGWFGAVPQAVVPLPVPALSAWSLIVLLGALALAARRRLSLHFLAARGRL